MDPPLTYRKVKREYSRFSHQRRFLNIRFLVAFLTGANTEKLYRNQSTHLTV